MPSVPSVPSLSVFPGFSDSSRVPADCFALLDDAQSGPMVAGSRLYTRLISVLECRDAVSWKGMLAQTQTALLQGAYAVALLSYDTGASLHAVPFPDVAAGALGEQPSRMLLFARCEQMTAQQVQAWLDAQTDACNSMPAGVAGIAGVRASVDETAFAEAIAQVQAYIAAGDTYQVNYTYRLHFDAYGSPPALYRRLRQRQPVPYGALIVLPDGEAVLSLSPELFVQHTAGTLTARPMKGTAAASGDAEEDRRRADALAADGKNRAENLMIVDLLRNDLGRIAKTGSVRVPRLFDVTRFSSVLQMTSTVEASLRPELDLHDVLSALYPCGSITGAPKRRTMQIIRELETEPRGLYTGAIGWFDPPADGSAIGDFCLSVPIRTLHLLAPSTDAADAADAVDTVNIRRGVLGVGAGIVYDSVAEDEYAECRLKAGFLTGLPAEFSLFETMHASMGEGFRHLERHLQRLRASAAYFGFAYDDAAIRARLEKLWNELRGELKSGPGGRSENAGAYRVRLALQASGEIDVSSGKLQALQTPARVLLAAETTAGHDLFLRHKTTVRNRYDRAWRAAEQQGAFDMLFFNERGYLTEGGRTNVLLQKDGRWTTPPLSDGVLPGVMRSAMLEDAAFGLSERQSTLEDLRNADRVMLCNALRGAFEVEVVFGSAR
ncbi:aminodeoxychorismate synthase component I [Undibacterium sp. TJN25]|uniref:aminodeoxychorismate synthase component I n=1 Tax=Undibacterium sp. TJN25 TaxID=3413056 RepID=UPI003BF3A029